MFVVFDAAIYLQSVILMGSRDCLEEIFLIDGYVVMKILKGWKKQRVPSSLLTLTTNLSELTEDISSKRVIITTLYI